MIPRQLVNLALLLGGATGALAACSEQDSLAPVIAPHGVEHPGPLSRPAPGSYELSFVSDGQAVSTLPVCTELVCPELGLKATVEDAAGDPAQSGTVTFQYCSLKGLPPNDIDRADEAPKEACESGEGGWRSLGSVKVILVDGSPHIPPLSFGTVDIARTVGFRFRYSSGGSGVANGVSEAENFLWTSP